MTGRRLSIVVLLAAALLNLHCQDEDGFARFDAQPIDGVEACEVEQFPFEPDFLTARTRSGRTGLFLESSRDSKHRSDVAYFELYDPDEVVAGEPLSLEGPQVPPPEARAKLAFLSQCPDSTLSISLEGELILDTFDPEPGGRVAGRLVDGTAINTRDRSPLLDNVEGEFEFTVRDGQPYQDFFAAP